MMTTTPTDRQRSYLSSLVMRIAERDGTSTGDVYYELGLMTDTSTGGRTYRAGVTRAQFSAAIDLAKQDLAGGV